MFNGSKSIQQTKQEMSQNNGGNVCRNNIGDLQEVKTRKEESATTIMHMFFTSSCPKPLNPFDVFGQDTIFVSCKKCQLTQK